MRPHRVQGGWVLGAGGVGDWLLLLLLPPLLQAAGCRCGMAAWQAEALSSGAVGHRHRPTAADRPPPPPLDDPRCTRPLAARAGRAATTWASMTSFERVIL